MMSTQQASRRRLAGFFKTFTLLTFMLITDNINKAESLVTSDGCGDKKGCFQYPADCETSTCEVLITWERNGTTTNFGLSGKIDSSEHYVSFAFSYDDHMGADDVWACLALSGGEIVLDHSNNVGEENNQLDTTGASNFESSSVDGKMECTFTRLNKIEGMESTFFDLDAQAYYLLEARGPRSGAKLGEHARSPLASDGPIDFAEATISSGSSGGSTSYKVHAIFMLIGWLGCASVAIVLARYYKPMWQDKTHFGQKVWFTWHRGLMVANTVCFCIAFVLIFIAVSGWVPYDSTNDTIFVHATIGCIVVALGIINPITAIFRPPPKSDNRPLFNWSHWAIGTSSYLLAVVNIFLGMDVFEMPAYSLWILAAWLGFHFLFEIFLETLNCMYDQSDAFTSYKVYKILKESPSSSTRNEKDRELSPEMEIGDYASGPTPADQQLALANVRFYALCTYLVVTIGILIYLVIEVILQ